jgi:hypothetical protein
MFDGMRNPCPICIGECREAICIEKEAAPCQLDLELPPSEFSYSTFG